MTKINWDPKFTNKISGETLISGRENDGTRHLEVVKTGVKGDRGGHSVLNFSGIPKYIRDTDGSRKI